MIQRSHLILLLMAVLFSSAISQNAARITTARVQGGGSEASMTLNVLCNGEPVYNLTNSQLIITDNGLPVQEFSITESSSPLVRHFFSVAMVMDASGSMAGAGNAGAKAAGHAFVDFMDGVIDEASVVFFESKVRVFQQMTTVKPMLHASVDALYANGMTAVWDACIAGLNELHSNGLNSKKAVLLLTDGGDNSSASSPTDIIALANQTGLRVFTVGLGTSINAAELQAIALNTGGLHFITPDPAQLQQIFTDIASFIGRGYDEHTIAFKSPDPDAVTHELQISVRTCNEVLPATRTVKSMNGLSVGNTAPAVPFALRLGQNAPNPVVTTAEIPFSLETSGAGQPVRLEIFDLLGRKVATLFNATITAGSYSVPFVSNELAQGMYVMRLSSGPVTQTRAMILRR